MVYITADKWGIQRLQALALEGFKKRLPEDIRKESFRDVLDHIYKNTSGPNDDLYIAAVLDSLSYLYLRDAALEENDEITLKAIDQAKEFVQIVEPVALQMAAKSKERTTKLRSDLGSNNDLVNALLKEKEEMSKKYREGLEEGRTAKVESMDLEARLAQSAKEQLRLSATVRRLIGSSEESAELQRRVEGLERDKGQF